jgi:hypothetical protein
MKHVAIVLALLAMQAHAAGGHLAESAGRTYRASETIRRAQIGTHSPRLAPPVHVILEPYSARIRSPGQRKPTNPQAFDRMDCRWQSPTDSIVCSPLRAEKINLSKKPR